MNIISYLETHGPSLSSDIKDFLVGSSRLTDVAARKAISRQVGIKKFEGIKFPKNAAFLYLPSQEKSAELYENLLKALDVTGSALFSPLFALRVWGGEVEYSRFELLSNCPSGRKKKVSVSSLRDQLVKANLIFVSEENGIKHVKLNQRILPLLNEGLKSRTMETLYQVLIASVSNWLGTNGFCAYNSVTQNSVFNSYTWSITAPSYFHPLKRVKDGKVKPGFVVADVYPQYKIDIGVVKGFVSKYEGARSSYTAGVFLPMLIGNSFDSDAFKYGKEKGVLITTPGNLLGYGVEEIISQLTRTLENVSAVAATGNESEIAKLISNVGKLEGKSINLRGQLFELLVGHIIVKSDRALIDIGKEIVTQNGEKAEIDVFCQYGNSKLISVECKGYNSHQRITRKIIEQWKIKTDRIKNWQKSHSEFSKRELKFEFWATCEYDTDAMELLNTLSSTKYKVDFKTKTEIIEIARKEHLKSIINVLNEQYN